MWFDDLIRLVDKYKAAGVEGSRLFNWHLSFIISIIARGADSEEDFLRALDVISQALKNVQWVDPEPPKKNE